MLFCPSWPAAPLFAELVEAGGHLLYALSFGRGQIVGLRGVGGQIEQFVSGRVRGRFLSRSALRPAGSALFDEHPVALTQCERGLPVVLQHQMVAGWRLHFLAEERGEDVEAVRTGASVSAP